jgi:signal transduction histidine kinase
VDPAATAGPETGVERAEPALGARIERASPAIPEPTPEPETPPHTLDGLVLAPVGRDGELIQAMLHSAGIGVSRVDSAQALVERIEGASAGAASPELGVIIATDDALGIDWSARLASLLEQQPSWSDLPLVLLARSLDASGDSQSLGLAQVMPAAERLMMRGSVTVLDRPVRVAALVSAVRAALRARARQIEVRDLIESRTRAMKLAERAAAAKSDFLALMSHELRTPLNAIAGYGELLSIGCYGPVTDVQREVLGRIATAQRHLLGIINDVLNLAKLEKGRVEYEICPVRLADVIGEVGPLIEPQLAAKQLAYEVETPDPGVEVRADREKLRQIMLNLLSNAVKFTRAGGRVKVDVAECGPRADVGPRVLLRISDTGAGIPADKLEAVFEPFVQVRTDANARSDGTGLGLAISRDLARGMGGDLRVRSELAKGSTFIVELLPA